MRSTGRCHSRSTTCGPQRCSNSLPRRGPTPFNAVTGAKSGLSEAGRKGTNGPDRRPAPCDYAHGEDFFLMPSPIFLMLSVVEARRLVLQPGWIDAQRPSSFVLRQAQDEGLRTKGLRVRIFS